MRSAMLPIPENKTGFDEACFIGSRFYDLADLGLQVCIFADGRELRELRRHVGRGAE
jgi:hypothetical protein